MWLTYYSPASIDEALELLAGTSSEARVVSGATDVMQEIDTGASRPGALIDISRIKGLTHLYLDASGRVHVGPGVTHRQLADDSYSRVALAPLAQSCQQIGSPQVRQRGTIAGNVMTASPAADTLPSLCVLDARIVLRSARRGERIIDIGEFILGPHRVAAAKDELITDIVLSPVLSQERACFMKLSDRQGMGISIVNIGVRIGFTDRGVVTHAAIALGSVAPTVVRPRRVEKALVGQPMADESIEQAARECAAATQPISDIRGSAEYRKWMVEALVRRALRGLRDTAIPGPHAVIPSAPGLTRQAGKATSQSLVHRAGNNDAIMLKVNGVERVVRGGVGGSLLDLLRDDLQMTGVKRGCGEGRCGVCTVLLDGCAVLGCLVPAPRAHGCEVLTIEGIAPEGRLHRLQEAFIDAGAVQCGYCTPGLVLSSYALLASNPSPTLDEIRTALSGHLCRCTGYSRILTAVQQAALESAT